MNREIKFRTWDNESKRMIVDEQDFIPLKVTNKGVLRLNPYHKECFWEFVDPSRFELMQFTGLTDKNGKEIYEGDIHMTEPVDIDGEMQSSYLPIMFDNGAFWIDESFDKDGTYLTLLCEYDEPLNIVGNIYENENLI